jgi:regulator of protease activity HflC (stomatin/prohibitin superfamily)
LIAILLLWIYFPFITIRAGSRGVVLSFGAFRGSVLEPGLHLINPISQTIVKMNVQTTALEVKASQAYSHDLQTVSIHSVINYNVNPSDTGNIYQQYGLEFESRILQPALEASIKQTVARYTAEELLNKRGEIQQEIENTFRAAIPNTFTVTKYALVNEDFTDQYEAAIEAKQVAQQNAEKAKNELEQAKTDAQAKIEKARGDAESIRIQAQAITQQGGADYVRLQWIAKWNGQMPQYQMGDATPLINLK